MKKIKLPAIDYKALVSDIAAAQLEQKDTETNRFTPLRQLDAAPLNKSRRKTRSGWDGAFAEMAKRGEDKLLDSNSFTVSSWDRSEWKWQL